MAGIKIKIDPVDKILLKRNLNQNGQAQKFFSSEVRRMSDPYVPFQKGTFEKYGQSVSESYRVHSAVCQKKLLWKQRLWYAGNQSRRIAW